MIAYSPIIPCLKSMQEKDGELDLCSCRAPSTKFILSSAEGLSPDWAREKIRIGNKESRAEAQGRQAKRPTTSDY